MQHRNEYHHEYIKPQDGFNPINPYLYVKYDSHMTSLNTIYLDSKPSFPYSRPPLLGIPVWRNAEEKRLVDHRGLNCDATGQVQWHIEDLHHPLIKISGVRYATGVLIDDDHFLVAGHTFDRTNIDKTTDQPFTPQEMSKLMRVNFNYHSDGTREVSYAIEELIEYKINGLDYAIVRLAGSPGKKHGCVNIRLPDPKSYFYTYSFHHPNGLPKKYSDSNIPSFTSPHEPSEMVCMMTMTAGSSGAGIFCADSHYMIAITLKGIGLGESSKFVMGVYTTDIYKASPKLREVVQAYPDLYETPIVEETAKTDNAGKQLALVGIFPHSELSISSANTSKDDVYFKLATIGRI